MNALTWARRAHICPGCAKSFRTDTGYAYHLAWSADCAQAYDSGTDPRGTGAKPTRVVWQDKRYGEAKSAEMRKIREGAGI